MRRKTAKPIKKKERDDIDEMVELEEKGLPPQREMRLFQNLVNTGQAWRLQGWYGRRAAELLKNGLITPPKKKTKLNQYDYYGNKIY